MMTNMNLSIIMKATNYILVIKYIQRNALTEEIMCFYIFILLLICIGFLIFCIFIFGIH